MANVRTIGMRRITVSVPVAGTAVPISATTLFVTDFEVFPLNANVGAAMYIGDSTVDNSWIPRVKNSPVNFVHGTGTILGSDPVVGFDLSKIFLDGDANNDTAVIQYFAIDVAS